MRARGALLITAIAAIAGACSLNAKGTHYGIDDATSISGQGGATSGAQGGATGTGDAGGFGGQSNTTAGAGGEGGSPGPVDWWNKAYPKRSLIRIQAGSVAVPAEYSIALTLNHAAMVAIGDSLASGDDIRVVCGEPGAFVEMDRLLDPGSAWEMATTMIWFRSPAPIFANGADTSCSLYYGAKADDAIKPPTDGMKVHLFYDDFESGSLAGWTQPSGAEIGMSNERAHRGSRSLKGSPIGSGGSRWIGALGPYEPDVSLDVYWYVTQVGGVDVAQGVRATGASPINQYETNFEGNDGGWDIAKVVKGTWSELEDQPATQAPQANTWVRITTRVKGTKMKVLRDGVQIMPAIDWKDVGGEITAGSAAFRVYRVPAGQGVWFDDVVLRRYVDPEPTATLGPAEAAPP